MSIRVEYSDEIDQPFVLIQVGEHAKLLKSTRLTAYMPVWLQEQLVNAVLCDVDSPRGGAAQPMAEVIDLERLREIRSKASSHTQVVQST